MIDNTGLSWKEQTNKIRRKLEWFLKKSVQIVFENRTGETAIHLWRAPNITEYIIIKRDSNTLIDENIMNDITERFEELAKIGPPMRFQNLYLMFSAAGRANLFRIYFFKYLRKK